MKKFVVQVFQQKYYLPSKLKETTSTCLKDVLQTKINTSVIHFNQRANTKKQLRSVQKFIISFIYDLIWNKITCPFVEIITPSIIKPQQLNKIVDFRNHHGYCQELELLQKSRTKSDSRTNTLPNVAAQNYNLKDSTKSFVSENKINNISTNKKYRKIIYEYHTEDSQLKNKPCISNSSDVHDMNKVDKKVELLVTVKNETLGNFAYQQESCISKSALQTNSNKIDSSFSNSTLNAKDSNLNESQKQNSVGNELVFLESNSKTCQSATTLSNKQPNTTNKNTNNKQDGIEKGTANNMSRDDISSNELPRDKKSKKDLNKYRTKKSYSARNNHKGKHLNEHINFMDKKPKNKKGIEKRVSEDNVMHNNDEILHNAFNESKQIKNQKSAETKPYLLDENVQINQAVQLQISKSYKYKKRKAKKEKRTKKHASKLNPEEEFKLKSKEKSKTTTKKVEGSKSLEDTVFHDTSVVSNSSKQIKSNMVRNSLKGNEKSILQTNKDVDLNSAEFADENKENPEIIKTSLISFDTTDDYAQLVIRDQSVGEEIKSDFINLKTVISEENSPKANKYKNTKTHDPSRTMDMRSKVKFKRSDGKVVKTATIKPWKMTKDMTGELKSITEGDKNSTSFHSDALKSSQKYSNQNKNKEDQTAEKQPKTLPSTVYGVSQQDDKNSKTSVKTVTAKSLFGKKRQKSVLTNKTLPLQPTSLKKSLSDVHQKSAVKEKVIFKEKSLNEELSSLKKNPTKSGSDIEIQNKHAKSVKISENIITTALDSRKNKDCADDNVFNSKNIKISFKPKLENTEMNNKLQHNTLNNKSASTRAVIKNEHNHSYDKTNVKTASVKKTTNNIQTNKSSDKKIDTNNQLYGSDHSVVAFELKSKTNSLLNHGPAIIPDTGKVSKFSNKNSNLVKSRNNDLVEIEKLKTNEEKSDKKDIKGVKNLHSKKITAANNVGKIQSQPPLNSKYTASSNNKTNFENRDDLSLSEAVAYINQGVNKIPGKEEFKFKIKKLLHNFTFTGQKNQENHHEPLKSQEVVGKNPETRNKLTKAISQKSLPREKPTEKEKLQMKTGSQNPLNKINSTSKDTKGNKTVIQTIKIEPEKTSLKTAGKLDKSNKHSMASIRPALKLSNDEKNHASVGTDEGETVKQQVVAKIRNTANVTSIKAKTVISNKIEPKNNTTEGMKNQSDPNNAFNKTTTKNTASSVSIDKFASKTEKSGKPVKRH